LVHKQPILCCGINQKGADQILSGKTKLVAMRRRPLVHRCSGHVLQRSAINVDVLTYSRSKGLFAGVSLEGATMDTDMAPTGLSTAKDLSAQEIVKGSQPVVPAAKTPVNCSTKRRRPVGPRRAARLKSSAFEIGLGLRSGRRKK